MAIPTSRTHKDASVTIERDLCCGCGLCVSTCLYCGFYLIDGKAAVNVDDSTLGCFGCGHCMALCPAKAVKVTGRTLSPDDLFPLPKREQAADYAGLSALLQRRRSIREFTSQPVSAEDIEKIVRAAQTAPVGATPSDVHLVILDNRQKVRQLSRDIGEAMEKSKWFLSPLVLSLLRPFIGKERHAVFRDFIRPYVAACAEAAKQGRDIIMYEAPLAVYFYTTPYADDQMIAATYAMLAGEALGLGSCMIGGVDPFFQIGPKGAQLREKYGVKYKGKNGIVVIFGYPAISYASGINRSFADVHRV